MSTGEWSVIEVGVDCWHQANAGLPDDVEIPVGELPVINWQCWWWPVGALVPRCPRLDSPLCTRLQSASVCLCKYSKFVLVGFSSSLNNKWTGVVYSEKEPNVPPLLFALQIVIMIHVSVPLLLLHWAYIQLAQLRPYDSLSLLKGNLVSDWWSEIFTGGHLTKNVKAEKAFREPFI